jgi:hypothetical protein
MKIFIVLIMFCGSLYAADPTNSAPADKHLVEVTFAMDDKPPTQMFHIVLTLYISEHNRGSQRDVYNWAHQGGYGPDPDTQKKATECIRLVKSLDEPNELPDNPNQIVTVRCADGDKTIIKKFPIDQVPSEVHQVLTIMGFRDEEFSRLKFIKKAA